MIDIRTIPGFNKAMTAAQRIDLYNAEATRRQAETKADEELFEKVHELQTIAQASKNLTPFGFTAIGAKADAERAFQARAALTPTQQTAYATWARRTR